MKAKIVSNLAESGITIDDNELFDTSIMVMCNADALGGNTVNTSELVTTVGRSLCDAIPMDGVVTSECFGKNFIQQIKKKALEDPIIARDRQLYGLNEEDIEKLVSKQLNIFVCEDTVLSSVAKERLVDITIKTFKEILSPESVNNKKSPVQIDSGCASILRPTDKNSGFLELLCDAMSNDPMFLDCDGLKEFVETLANDVSMTFTIDSHIQERVESKFLEIFVKTAVAYLSGSTLTQSTDSVENQVLEPPKELLSMHSKTTTKLVIDCTTVSPQAVKYIVDEIIPSSGITIVSMKIGTPSGDGDNSKLIITYTQDSKKSIF
jgi:hypothetical protein